MNKFIKAALGKLKVAKPDKIEGNEILFKKINSIKIEEDHCYLIKLSDSILYPSDNSTLASN